MSKLNKIQELLLFILDRAHKKELKNLSDFQLVKILYLIQVFSIKYTGLEFIPNIIFFREERGPLTSEYYKAIHFLQKQNYVEKDVIPNPEYGHPRHANKLNKKKKFPKSSFSLGETIFLDNFLSDLLLLSQKKLKETTYKTEPMKEILNKEKGRIKKGVIIDFGKVRVDPDVVDTCSVS